MNQAEIFTEGKPRIMPQEERPQKHGQLRYILSNGLRNAESGNGQWISSPGSPGVMSPVYIPDCPGSVTHVEVTAHFQHLLQVMYVGVEPAGQYKCPQNLLGRLHSL